MDEQPQPRERGLRLLAAHLRSLDPASSTAHERLEEAMGPELARKLVYALTSGQRERRAA